jgi:histidyl-tRNA synthetase
MIYKIKGTQDILPEDSRRWQAVEKAIRYVSSLYHYKEIRTPIFEDSVLFHRGVGESTDIIKKETYDFQDRGGRMITLRPEGTAPIVRSVVENKLYATEPLPLKLYYYGPMFRYERPQKGRQRQFHQFGAEAIGSVSPQIDAEMIAYALSFLCHIGIDHVQVKINTLGDHDDQQHYKYVLTEYLRPQIGLLCGDCQRRFEENPLRVLDCKVDRDHVVLTEAPKPLSIIKDAAKDHFSQLQAYLNQMHIPYIIDTSLVRGLDYYTHTVFELEADLPSLGAQATLGGGGRYDRLSEDLGGPELPSVGFAFGLERLLLALESVSSQTEDERLHGFMIVLGDRPRVKAMEICESLRQSGLMIDSVFSDRSLKAQFRHAERFKPCYFLIFGDSELDENRINVKNASSGEEVRVKLDELSLYLSGKITSDQEKAHECCHHSSESGEK